MSITCQETSCPGYAEQCNMHEFSLAGEVIRIAEYEAEKNMANIVNEVNIEAGNFCGIEIDAFRSALEILAEGSILKNACFNILTIKGKGKCHACNIEFEMDRRFDTCPLCNALPSEITGGYEFRVASIIIEKE